MKEFSRRYFMTGGICDQPAYKNNEVCLDPALKFQVESGNKDALKWLQESSAAGDTAKCSSMILVGGGIIGGLKWLAERRKKLALKPEEIDFSHVE